MPRYFFHIRGPAHFFVDDEGIDFCDLNAALEEAVETASRVARNARLARDVVSDNVIEITDERGTVLLRYSIRNAGLVMNT